MEVQQLESEHIQKLMKMRDFRKKIRVLDYKYVNVILLGPRYSGKTSIRELWTTPWTNIQTIQASTDWTTQEFTIHEFEATQRFDPIFEVQADYVPTLRIRIWDYPGEDAYRVTALEHLVKMEGPSVLVLVMSVDCPGDVIEEHRRNSSYYSMTFVEDVTKTLRMITDHVNKIFVVFNKSDLLPAQLDDKQKLDKLMQANKHAISSIERMFAGNLEYRVVSSRTNYKLISLLGEIGLVAINSKPERSRFENSLQKVEEQAQDIGSRKVPL